MLVETDFPVPHLLGTRSNARTNKLVAEEKVYKLSVEDFSNAVRRQFILLIRANERAVFHHPFQAIGVGFVNPLLDDIVNKGFASFSVRKTFRTLRG